jgi:hypothetical protein
MDVLFNVPPGSAKSRIISVCTTPWMWLHWPGWRAIYLSANPRVAGGRVRAVVRPLFSQVTDSLR